jgi:uncharacterized membrane protein YeiH
VTKDPGVGSHVTHESSVVILHQFVVPIWLELSATALFAYTGAVVGIRAGYDYVGAYALAFASAVGGGIIRDGLLLGLGIPAALRDWRYSAIILAATLIAGFTIRFINFIDRFEISVTVIDSMGLSLFAVVGLMKSIQVHLDWLPAIIVGVFSAVGGGVIRDLLAVQPPLLFRPSQYYALTALVGCSAFWIMQQYLHFDNGISGLVSVVIIMTLRLLSVRFDWRTRPLLEIAE